MSDQVIGILIGVFGTLILGVAANLLTPVIPPASSKVRNLILNWIAKSSRAETERRILVLSQELSSLERLTNRPEIMLARLLVVALMILCFMWLSLVLLNSQSLSSELNAWLREDDRLAEIVLLLMAFSLAFALAMGTSVIGFPEYTQRKSDCRKTSRTFGVACNRG